MRPLLSSTAADTEKIKRNDKITLRLDVYAAVNSDEMGKIVKQTETDQLWALTCFYMGGALGEYWGSSNTITSPMRATFSNSVLQFC